MKNIITILLLALSGNLFAFTLNTTNSALDLNASNPISNHWVYIEANDSINFYYYFDSIQTNSNGVYSFNINGVPSQNTIFTIYTYDCSSIQHSRTVSTANPSTTPFTICINTPPPSSISYHSTS